MKIAELAIDRFGACSDVRLSDIGPGLTVFYGPNETGKTTVMQFVRSVLHGFSSERRRRYLPPVAGYPAGGTLTVWQGAERCELSREIDRDGYETELQIRPVQGDELSAQRVRDALVGVDEQVFNNVFVLGLQDLQQLGSLTDTRASEFLFRIAAGVDRVSLYEVMADLGESRNRLLSADDRPCEVMHLLAQVDRLRGEVRELSSATGQYSQLMAQQREVTSELKQVRAARQKAHEALERLRVAQAIRPAWLLRAELDAQIAAMGEVPSVSNDALAQIEALDARRRAMRREYVQARDKRHALSARCQEMQVNDDLWCQAARIEALCDQREWIGDLEAQRDAVAGEVDALSAKVAAQRNRMGIANNATGRALGRKQLSSLRKLALAVRDSRRQLKELQQQGQQHAQSLAALDQQVAGGLAQRIEPSLSEALEQQGEVVSQLRHRLDLDERAEHLSRQLKDLEAQRLELLERQVIPGWVIGTVGGFFAMGICLLLAGLVLPLPMSGTFSLALAAIGGLGAIGAGGAKYLIEHTNHRKLERCENQLSVLSLQIKQNKEERAEIDRSLPTGTGPLTVRLQAAEAELAQLEALIPLNARRQSMARDQEAHEFAQLELREKLQAARAAWQAALAEAGLPADFDPAQIKTLRRSSTQYDRLREQLHARQQELEQRERAIAQFAERIGPYLPLAGIIPSGRRLGEQINLLGTTLESIRGQATERDSVRRELTLAGRQERKLRGMLRRLKSRRQALLLASGVEHEEELRRAQARLERLNALRVQRDAAQNEIDTHLAGRYSDEALINWIELAGDLPLFEARITEHSATLTSCDQRADDLARQHGELNERIKTLVADRRLPNRQIDLAMAQERLRQALERWQVLALSWSILDKLRREYEHQRQPETLRVASVYFQRLTGDRYRRVWTPLGETTLLVNDQSGQSLPIELLSRGTREQLYLALRLALVESYVKRGIHLPLVLDDLLVNFDAQRAKAAALVLRDFAAAGHQVLMFTCHEHLMRLFRSLGVAVRALPGATLEPEPMPVIEPVRIEPEPAVAVAEARPKRRPAREDEPPLEEKRPVRRRERIVERPRMPAAPDTSWDAEEFAGEFAERRVVEGEEPGEPAGAQANRDEAA